MKYVKTNLSMLALVSVLFLPGAGARGQVGTEQWKKVAPISPGVEGAAASLIGDKIYVSHGYRSGIGDSVGLSIYQIDPKPGLGSWTAGPDASCARSEMAGGTAKGKHYAIGGRTNLSCVEEFTPGGAWRTVAPLTFPRGGLGAASWGDKIYAIGGRDGSTFGTGTKSDKNECYDPNVGPLGTWTTKAPIPIAVSDNYATIAYNGRVYVFGGVDALGAVLCTTQIYDIASNTWVVGGGAPMPTCRGDAMAGVCGRDIVVFGGYDPAVGNLAVSEQYEPATNTWSAGPPLNQGASEMAQGVTYNSTEMWAIGTGIFGVSGSVVQALNCAPLIPAVSEWGLAVLTLIGLVSGTILFGRRRAAAH